MRRLEWNRHSEHSTKASAHDGVAPPSLVQRNWRNSYTSPLPDWPVSFFPSTTRRSRLSWRTRGRLRREKCPSHSVLDGSAPVGAFFVGYRCNVHGEESPAGPAAEGWATVHATCQSRSGSQAIRTLSRWPFAVRISHALPVIVRWRESAIVKPSFAPYSSARPSSSTWLARASTGLVSR